MFSRYTPHPFPFQTKVRTQLFRPLLYINIPYPQVFFSIPPSCNVVARKPSCGDFNHSFWGENVNLMRIVIVTRRIIVGEPS